MVRQALEGEPVRRFMQPNPVTVPPTLTVQELVESYIYAYHLKMFPVVHQGKVLGWISTREIKQLPRHLWKQHTVQDLLKPCSVDNCVRPQDDALQALTKMNQTGLGRLMVIDTNQLVGVIALKDLLNFLALKVELGDRDDG